MRNIMYRPKLIVLVGIPGAGKTTYAKEYVRTHGKTIHISYDPIQGSQSEAFSLIQQRVVDALKSGNNVIYDSTATTRNDRASIIDVCPRYVQLEAHIIWAPIETCIERDAHRDRCVGSAVIDKMVKRFQAPYYYEGFDSIDVIRPDMFDDVAYFRKCMDDMKIPHDNPHHTLSVYDHCVKASSQIDDTQSELFYAAMVHDVGKPYVKSFTDSKSRPCDVAHYYQHHCVGSYMSYGFPFITPKIAWLVSMHMDPFMNTKYYRNLPAYLKKDIDILHDADVNAH